MHRSSVVDTALPQGWVKENAIAVGIFDETFTVSDGSNELPFESIDVISHIHFLSDCGDFLIADPNETGLGTLATVATACALEGQTGLIPNLRHAGPLFEFVSQYDT